MFQQLASNAGWTALFSLFILLVSVLIAWYALQVVRWDVFLKDAKSRPAAVLRLLIAVALGYQLAKFVNEYLMASLLIKGIF
ncbi:MAG: DUF1146 domain-containing protein [Tumebacillaceae bacterium]